MLQLNGIVGGTKAVRVAPRQNFLLQQIVLTVKGGQKLTLRSVIFLFNNEAFAIKVEANPSPGVFIAKGGFGDLKPNKVLFHNKSSEDVIIFLTVSAVNTAKNTRFLSRSDSWHLGITRCSK